MLQFRERRYHMEVRRGHRLTGILREVGCPDSETEGNDAEMMLAIQPENEIPSRRGDIPSIHELNDGELHPHFPFTHVRAALKFNYTGFLRLLNPTPSFQIDRFDW